MKVVLFVLLSLPLSLSAQMLCGGRVIGHDPLPAGPEERMACLTTQLFPTDSWPQGLAIVDDRFWVMYVSSQYVVAYDEFGAPLDTLDITENVDNWGGIYHENGTLWIVREQAAKLYQFEMSTGTLMHEFQLPMISTDPNYWGVTRLGADLIVSYYANTSGGTTLYRVDGSNGTLLDSTFVNGVWLLELSTMMGELYGVEVFGELIHHIDPATGTILSTADWCLSYAYGVDVSFDHGMVGVDAWVPAVFAVDNTTSIDDPGSGPPLTLGPNPADDDLTIELQDDSYRSITLRSVEGREVRSWTPALGTQVFDMGDVPAGSYFVTFEGTEPITRRLMVAH